MHVDEQYNKNICVSAFSLNDV